ncbi:hypothetical protein FRC10_009559, partial [Ceratobasidium sp. 414]
STSGGPGSQSFKEPENSQDDSDTSINVDERHENGGDEDEVDNWEKDSEGGPSEYGVSPTLLDLLADQPVEGAQVLGTTAKVIRQSPPAKGMLSAKKDTTGVDKSSF